MVDVMLSSRANAIAVHGVTEVVRVRNPGNSLQRANTLVRALCWHSDAPFLWGFLGMPIAVVLCVAMGPYLPIDAVRWVFAISVTCIAYSAITMFLLRYRYYPRGILLARELDRLAHRSVRVQCLLEEWCTRDPRLAVRLAWWRLHAERRVM
ncbi:hypothetical protein HY632_04170 [Candidatus Uhrbacteria bacterium]|nr:hypothetical protein [Candidatus Uhrbacteria bacterium]